MADGVRQANLKVAVNREFPNNVEITNILEAIVPTDLKKVYEGKATERDKTVCIPTSDIAIDKDYNVYVRNVELGNQNRGKETPVSVRILKDDLFINIPESELENISFLSEVTEEYIPVIGTDHLSFTKEKFDK